MFLTHANHSAWRGNMIRAARIINEVNSFSLWCLPWPIFRQKNQSNAHFDMINSTPNRGCSNFKRNGRSPLRGNRDTFRYCRRQGHWFRDCPLEGKMKNRLDTPQGRIAPPCRGMLLPRGQSWYHRPHSRQKHLPTWCGISDAVLRWIWTMLNVSLMPHNFMFQIYHMKYRN